ncbi:cold shock domain-containing protein [Shewanella sp. Isolate7]|uniref:cold shock domain-containing protein n=1 Tax=Shewanella sp. Isolate7 TaxID=2908528 RepID=UPI001EFE68C7|nr:cold shock domain-containing protein [Shewanella sp. Isolate7]MCG9723175.1 cold shock domain-containing protein [Shewanella sp. Isolate7]
MERGTLVRWNDDRGFGFIKPNTPNAQDVFIHISALKQMARKPVVGDEIVYQSQQQSDGKIKATKASIEGVAVISGVTSGLANKPTRSQCKDHTPTSHYSHRRSGSRLQRMIFIIILVSIGSFAIKQYQALRTALALIAATVQGIQLRACRGLLKLNNAEMVLLSKPRRARLTAVFAALQFLRRTRAIRCKLCLASIHFKHTQSKYGTYSHLP